MADEDSWIGRDSVVGDAAVDSGAAGGYVAVVDAVIDIPSNAGKNMGSLHTLGATMTMMMIVILLLPL